MQNMHIKILNPSQIPIFLINIKYKNQKIDSTNTTPDSISINYHLSEMIKSNVKICFMEVSSHGIDQKRIEGLFFKGVIFTNLTHDHIDYHKTFANYRDTKKKIFDSLSNKSFSLINHYLIYHFAKFY